MIYATSDLHGYPLPDFLRLLNKACFSEADFLFVLGDVVDRNGDGGIAMLEWMMLQPNVQLILGNHEAMLLSCDFLFQEITDDLVSRLNLDQISLMMNWMQNGAEPTLNALHALRRRDPEALFDLLDYLKDASLYDTVTAGGRDFLLVHSGLGHFRKDKPLSESGLKEKHNILVMLVESGTGKAEPANARTVFYPGDKLTVFGNYATISRVFHARERFSDQ